MWDESLSSVLFRNLGMEADTKGPSTCPRRARKSEALLLTRTAAIESFLPLLEVVRMRERG